MQENYSTFQTPAYVPRETVFVATKESLAVYDELNAIAEELEKCRKRNSLSY